MFSRREAGFRRQFSFVFRALILSSFVFSSLATDCTPPDLRRKLDDEAIIDHVQMSWGRVSGPLDRISIPSRKGPVAVRAGVLRNITPTVDTNLLQQRISLPEKWRTLRGFRATLFGPETWPMTLATNATPVEVEVEALVRERLPCDGLLKVAVAASRRLNATEANAAEDLRRVGFPVDLLDAFAHPNGASILQLVAAGNLAELQKAEFRWRPAASGFAAASENGLNAISSARVQLRGDYNDGIVPGSGFDVAGQLVMALPETRFIMSVHDRWTQVTSYQALSAWKLRRRNQITLISEPLNVGGWAQDNGKGGSIAGLPAVLTPRYASIDNEETEFSPADSYALENLRAAGIRVVQSALLFQGGNTLVVRDPKTDARVLLLSEIEIWRNMRLGLSREQTLAAFKIDFGVERVVPLPMVSYHLDYEVTCRNVASNLVVLVNDPLPLARKIVELVDSRLSAAGVRAADLQPADPRVETLFRAAPIDSPSINFMLYRVAQDWLDAARGQPSAYHDALRRHIAGLADLRRVLQAEGWQAAPVSSMPALRVGINYLNGIQDQTRFIMPAYGGFFAPLDENAAAEIKRAFPGIEVVPIACPQLQTHQGALHCIVSIFPAAGNLPN